jgi:hypothetical protein
MALEAITREEFDKRVDAANERRVQELQQMEEQQAKAEQLLSYYEHALDEIEAELAAAGETAPLPVLLRKRLNELAERTAKVAASV